MSKRAILRLDGCLETGFHVTLEVGAEGNLNMAEGDGHLAASPELIACLAQWQSSYGDLSHGTRIKVNNIRVQKASTQSVEVCRRDGQALQLAFQGWLGGEAFRSIDMQLREVVTHDDLVRVVIRTKDRRLHLLPWHTWRFVDHYRAEVGFSLSSRQASEPIALSQFGKVKILAILGHSAGIDTLADRKLLEGLPDADVTFLVEPDRQQINDQLWEQRWDILFFAGHSLTRDGAGIIHINPEDCLSVEDLKFGLRRAIDRGLQLAIFNSCDGLGLAYEVEQLGLPQMVVMRQPVPDPVAQAFLKDLLTSFVGGQRFYLAVREAREKLQGFEQRYPCASWLPVIFQNPTQPSLSWGDFRESRGIGQSASASADQKLVRHSRPRKRLKFRSLMLLSLLVGGLVCGVRTMGFLEPAELWAYDRMLQLQPAILPDQRILVVAVNDEDVARFGKPLSDQTILKLLTTLEQYKPKVIGLDIYRDIPLDPGHQELMNYFKQSNLRSKQSIIAICDAAIPGEFSSRPKPPTLADERLGFAITLMHDSDDKVRRYSLSTTNQEPACQADSSFGLQVVRQYLKDYLPEATNIYSNKLKIPILQKQFSAYQQTFRSAPKADKIIPGEQQVMIHYHPSKIVAEEVSLSKILDNPKSVFLQDKIILIGYANMKTTDRHPTPVGEVLGVRIHAHIVRQLLDSAMNLSSFMSTWSNLSDLSWILFWSILGGVFSRLTSSRRGFISLMAIGCLTLLLICFWAFSSFLWVPFLPPIIAFLGVIITARYLTLVSSFTLSKLSEARK
jgi:CHASE2 domain-containing sensor protein